MHFLLCTCMYKNQKTAYTLPSKVYLTACNINFNTSYYTYGLLRLNHLTAINAGPHMGLTPHSPSTNVSVVPMLLMSLLLAEQQFQATQAWCKSVCMCTKHAIALNMLCLLIGYWTSQQHASVSLKNISAHAIFMCCHTEKKVADQTF